MGQRASFGIGQFNSFCAYTTPIIGAIIADEDLGRFNTIFIAIAFSILGHILLIVSAIPAVLTSGNAIAPFILGVITLGFGTGAFKANISPLIAEQYRQTKPRVIIDPKTGERVISDPNVTLSRIFLYFYLFINVGSLTGQLSMVYVEKYGEPPFPPLQPHGLISSSSRLLVRIPAANTHVLLLSCRAMVLPGQVPREPTHRLRLDPRFQAPEARPEREMEHKPHANAQELQERAVLGRR